MDRVSACGFGGSEDLVSAQVAVGSGGRTDMHGLVSFANVFGARVSVRIDRDRADSKVAAGGHDTTGDFAAIGNEEAFDHGRSKTRFCRKRQVAGLCLASGGMHAVNCCDQNEADNHQQVP